MESILRKLTLKNKTRPLTSRSRRHLTRQKLQNMLRVTVQSISNFLKIVNHRTHTDPPILQPRQLQTLTLRTHFGTLPTRLLQHGLIIISHETSPQQEHTHHTIKNLFITTTTINTAQNSTSKPQLPPSISKQSQNKHRMHDQFREPKTHPHKQTKTRNKRNTAKALHDLAKKIFLELSIERPATLDSTCKFDHSVEKKFDQSTETSVTIGFHVD